MAVYARTVLLTAVLLCLWGQASADSPTDAVSRLISRVLGEEYPSQFALEVLPPVSGKNAMQLSSR